MKISCIAIDDEPLALELIAQNIHKVAGLELIATFTNSKKAFQFLQQHRVDLVFLDIQLPGLNGLELSRTLPAETKIIFTTAFEHYALQSYEVAALDYILKPIDSDRFDLACRRAISHFQQHNKSGRSSTITISSEHEKHLIAISDITYIEGLKDYVKVHLISAAKPILTRMNLKTFENNFGSDSFLRVHKSFLVNTSRIKKVGSRCIVMDTHVEIPLGDVYKPQVVKLLQG